MGRCGQIHNRRGAASRQERTGHRRGRNGMRSRGEQQALYMVPPHKNITETTRSSPLTPGELDVHHLKPAALQARAERMHHGLRRGGRKDRRSSGGWVTGRAGRAGGLRFRGRKGAVQSRARRARPPCSALPARLSARPPSSAGAGHRGKPAQTQSSWGPRPTPCEQHERMVGRRVMPEGSCWTRA